MSDYFLADDLSGALDAAAAFHAVGRPVRIVWSSAAWDEARPEEVVGFTTETRNAAPAVAAAAVTRAIEAGRARGARLRYKKIDSTLRGPVAAELQALAAALPDARVLFTPANPAVGRTVRDGVLRVHGVPVAETEFGRDPGSPVGESRIRQHLGAAAGDRVRIADAESEADLAAAVAEMDRAGGAWVGVGSGALARPVALALGPRAPANPPASHQPRQGPRVMICGSAHLANRAQAELLRRDCGVPICEVAVAAPERGAARALTAIREHGAATLLLESARHESAAALRAITRAAVEVIAATAVDRLFVTGGETAYAICGELGLGALKYRAELEPGLSLSEGATSRGPVLLAIKPGGFGDEQTWLRAWTALGRG